MAEAILSSPARPSVGDHLLPWRILGHLWSFQHLIRRFAAREILGRYRGTVLGIFWSLITPLLMLCVYLFVFGEIFKSRFGEGRHETTWDYGLALFCGLNVFNLISEVVIGSPNLMLQHKNYVKKVVFPLEVLPVVITLTGLFHCILAFVPLAIGLAFARQAVPWTALYLIPLLVPLAFGVVGLSWFISALGVFIRDVAQILNSVLLVVMFLSAIFYPLEAIPSSFRGYFMANPLALYVQTCRKAVVWDQGLNWSLWLYFMALGLIVFVFGYRAFLRAKPAFADVL